MKMIFIGSNFSFYRSHAGAWERDNYFMGTRYELNLMALTLTPIIKCAKISLKNFKNFIVSLVE